MKFMKVRTIKKNIPTTMNKSNNLATFSIGRNSLNIDGNSEVIIIPKNTSTHIIKLIAPKYFLRKQ